MNSPSRTFHDAVAEAKYSQLYIKTYYIVVMRSGLPHAGDEYLMSLLRLSVEGEKWASDVRSSISKLMSNKCGCDVARTSADCQWDGTCGPLQRYVGRQKDLIGGHCYFESKNAVVPLIKSIYTKDTDPRFGLEEEGGFMRANMSEWKESWA